MFTARIAGGMIRYQRLWRSLGKTCRATRQRDPASAEYCFTIGNQPAEAVPAVECGHQKMVRAMGMTTKSARTTHMLRWASHAPPARSAMTRRSIA